MTMMIARITIIGDISTAQGACKAIQNNSDIMKYRGIKGIHSLKD